jgi:hypothetical protein
MNSARICSLVNKYTATVEETCVERLKGGKTPQKTYVAGLNGLDFVIVFVDSDDLLLGGNGDKCCGK